MPGSPKKRARTEHAQLNGEITTPQPDMTTIEKEIERMTAEMKKMQEEGRGATRNGGTKEYMQLMAKRRKLQGQIDPTKAPGRARTKFKRFEIEQNAIDELVPKAIKVLRQQIDDKTLDPADKRAAAKMILEWGKSKPAQKIEQKVDGVTSIMFETVAFGALPPPDYDYDGEVEEDQEELEAGA